MSMKFCAALAAFAVAASPAMAAVVVDQSQLTGGGGLANISANSHPLQSFQTSAGNIAGGGFFLTTVSGDEPVTFEIALWSLLPNDLGTVQLASGTVEADGTDGQWLDAFWTPVLADAATTYYLSIDVVSPGGFGSLAGVFGGNPYGDGELYLRDAGGPDYQTYGSDTTFRTYADVTGGVPEPATWALMILGFGAAGAMLRRGATGRASSVR